MEIGLKTMDLTGQRYGRLTVISAVKKNSYGKFFWLCKCDCGNKKVIYGASLRNGDIQSCGCFSREIRSIKTRERNLNKTPMSLFDRFKEKYEVVTETGCWIWTAACNRHGYGLMGPRCKNGMSAHRASWTIHKGPIPEGLCVLHHCDTPSCVNPHHLFIGTFSDNMQDMLKKGRRTSPSGENNHKTRITSQQAIDIKHSALKPKELGKKYNIATNTVYGIRSGKTWKFVEGEGE
jgi:hypothetical protein